MPAAADPRHFTRAVTELGRKRLVVVQSPVFNVQGMKILDRGVAVDASLYERLTQHQLSLPLAHSVGSEPAITGPVLREAMQALGRNEAFFSAMLEDPRLGARFLAELELLPLPPAIAFQLTLMHETQGEQWLHALRSTVTAAWLGATQGATRYDLRLLAATGLLHDLGMLHLDPVLLRPELALRREQRRQLYSHPLISAALLERHHEYPREMLRAVLEHHEALDGSGYPRNLNGAQISPWGRVLALTEVVTAMFAPDRPNPGLRLSLVLRMNRHRFDATLVQEISRLLPAMGSDAAPPMSDEPAQVLQTVAGLLARWLTALPDDAALPKPRATAVLRVGELCGQLQRMLGGAGVAPAQLAQLGDAVSTDAALRAELASVAHEAVWQLRHIARQARRRWQLAPDEAFPAGLQRWLEEADALCERHLSV